MLDKRGDRREAGAPEDLATDGKTLYIADGRRVSAARGRRRDEVARFDRPITALCCLPGGGIAVALDGREVQVFADAAGDGADRRPSRRRSMRSVNALAAAGATALLRHRRLRRHAPYDDGTHDLMERGRQRPRAVASTSPAAAMSRHSQRD